MGFHHVGQAGLKLLTSSDPPALVSQSAGITGRSHCTRPNTHVLKTMPGTWLGSEDSKMHIVSALKGRVSLFWPDWSQIPDLRLSACDCGRKIFSPLYQDSFCIGVRVANNRILNLLTSPSCQHVKKDMFVSPSTMIGKACPGKPTTWYLFLNASSLKISINVSVDDGSGGGGDDDDIDGGGDDDGDDGGGDDDIDGGGDDDGDDGGGDDDDIDGGGDDDDIDDGGDDDIDGGGDDGGDDIDDDGDDDDIDDDSGDDDDIDDGGGDDIDDDSGDDDDIDGGGDDGGDDDDIDDGGDDDDIDGGGDDIDDDGDDDDIDGGGDDDGGDDDDIYDDGGGDDDIDDGGGDDDIDDDGGDDDDNGSGIIDLACVIVTHPWKLSLKLSPSGKDFLRKWYLKDLHQVENRKKSLPG
ncbi:hypothetical protein AAY473_026741 [Plecturocebus cupreus]